MEHMFIQLFRWERLLAVERNTIWNKFSSLSEVFTIFIIAFMFDIFNSLDEMIGVHDQSFTKLFNENQLKIKKLITDYREF